MDSYLRRIITFLSYLLSQGLSAAQALGRAAGIYRDIPPTTLESALGQARLGLITAANANRLQLDDPLYVALGQTDRPADAVSVYVRVRLTNERGAFYWITVRQDALWENTLGTVFQGVLDQLEQILARSPGLRVTDAFIAPPLWITPDTPTGRRR